MNEIKRGKVSLKIAIWLVTFLFLLGGHSFAQELQKAKVYKGSEDIEQWVMSEKLDGIRGYWDGTQLKTRKGVLINAPDWFLKNFPPFELDGELWSDRNQFEFIQSVVLDKKPSADWRKITYNLFEVPKAPGSFTARLKIAEDWFAKHPNEYVQIIQQITCSDKDHLQQFLAEIEAKGGEGVIVKDPALPYHTGRSAHVLKVKNHEDMEGIVIGINPGKGKFANMMGSLTLKLDNGLTFKLGTGFSNNVRQHPPQVGDVVTFKYFGFTKKGKPKFASFLRVRGD